MTPTYNIPPTALTTARRPRGLINIKGPVARRRRLLSMIRANFDRIHGSIKNLKPIEIVPLPEQPDAYVPYVELLAWEESGKEEFEKVVDGEIITLKVQRLLNGVETEGERARASGLRESHDIERPRAILEAMRDADSMRSRGR